jgi:hypothetical protein
MNKSHAYDVNNFAYDPPSFIFYFNSNFCENVFSNLECKVIKNEIYFTILFI